MASGAGLATTIAGFSVGQSLPVNTDALPLHPDRHTLFNELHARPFPLLQPGTRISQLALLHQGHTADDEVAHLGRLASLLGLPAPANSASCHHLDFGSFELRWERHTEFSTYTILREACSQEPFAATALSLLPTAWVRELPGQVLSSLHVEIHDQARIGNTPDEVRPSFEGHRLISAWVLGRKARLWTAWRLHRDGMGRILIQNQGLNPCQLGRLVRRLLELENYRMMVLLAFPVARQIGPDLAAMGAELAGINAEITAIAGLDDERRLLAALSALAARIEQIRSETTFRFTATRAYYDLVQDRLQGLREQEEPGMQTFSEFLPRRLTPAFRTVIAVVDQLDELAERIDRASELLRTRIDLTLEAQNQDLLHSMNRRSEAQLQLQQAVEGLSVVAISYYLVGLVKYAAESLKDMGWLEHPALITGLAVPVCAVLVWRGMRRLRRAMPAA